MTIGIKRKQEIMDNVITAIKNKQGKLLSTDKYISTREKLRVKCYNEHIFEISISHLLQGHWCAKCSVSFSERIVRLYFETLFNNKFPKIRPKWLINVRGNKMELDGYCEELSLAFEHNGSQHYKVIKEFHMTEETLAQLKLDDKYKIDLCKQNNVNLIVIPQLFKQLKVSELKDFIKQECINKKIALPNNFDNIEVDYNIIYINDEKEKKLTELQKIAQSKNGRLISTQYIGCKEKLQWECKEKHIFLMCPDKVKRGRWCQQCNCPPLVTINDMHNLAKQHNGECLSKEYINSRTNLKWKCKEGHCFEALPSNISSGHWCAECVGRKKDTIEHMQEFAKKHNGECLSEEYINCWTALSWKCNKNHIFLMTPELVKRGCWCQYCAGRGNFQINFM